MAHAVSCMGDPERPPGFNFLTQGVTGIWAVNSPWKQLLSLSLPVTV